MESMHVGNELIVNIKVNVSTFSKHEYTSLTKHIYYIKHEVSYASLSMTKTVFFVVSDMYIIRTRKTSTLIPRNEIFDMEDHMTSVTIILYYHTLDTKLPRGFHYLNKIHPELQIAQQFHLLWSALSLIARSPYTISWTFRDITCYK